MVGDASWDGYVMSKHNFTVTELLLPLFGHQALAVEGRAHSSTR
jgi:hypothetical protein